VPFYAHLVKGTNDQYSFLHVIASWIECSYLVSGDVLVMDNCGIHAAKDSVDLLYGCLEAAGVRLIFLPPYSPELNPCELVFASVKNYLKHNRGLDKFDREIMFALSCQSFETVAKMYFDCVWMDVLCPIEF